MSETLLSSTSGYWYVKIILAMLIYKFSCTKLINRMVEILRHSVCKIR